MRQALIPVGIGAIVLAGGWWYMARQDSVTAQRPEQVAQTEGQPSEMQQNAPKQQSAASGEDNLVEFACADSKKITAVFRPETVGLTLSDGRQIELRQDVSGSGIRYVSNDGRIEFRGKGEEGFLEEEGTITYSNCHSSRL